MVAVQMAPARNEPSFAVSVARDGSVRDFVMLPPIRAGLNGDQEQVCFSPWSVVWGLGCGLGGVVGW